MKDDLKKIYLKWSQTANEFVGKDKNRAVIVIGADKDNILHLERYNSREAVVEAVCLTLCELENSGGDDVIQAFIEGVGSYLDMWNEKNGGKLDEKEEES